jgi:hypothetical protein
MHKLRFHPFVNPNVIPLTKVEAENQITPAFSPRPF